MDRLEHREHDVRGPRPRTAAHPLNSRIHPLGDISFNPAARPGDADWRVLYVACGDGGSGDSRGSYRLNPQRLDTLVGKILRIVPDLAEHATTAPSATTAATAFRATIRSFAVAGARTGDSGPTACATRIVSAGASRAGRRTSIASMIGWRTWETVLLIHKGGNYGFPLREGGEVVEGDRTISALPEPDDCRCM